MLAAASRPACSRADTLRLGRTCRLLQCSPSRSLITTSREQRLRRIPSKQAESSCTRAHACLFSTSTASRAKQLKPYLLADVGEGITECEIIKWFVQPGATIQEFDQLVEVQSDKASVEITSRYAGIVKTLHHAEGDVAKVGSALCDIEVEAEVEESGPAAEAVGAQAASETQLQSPPPVDASASTDSQQSQPIQSFTSTSSSASPVLATPAVRRVSREHGVNLSDIRGSGRDGRVLKEDVMAFLDSSGNQAGPSFTASATGAASASSRNSVQSVSLSPIRRAMFKAMTASHAIPHFGYSDELDVTALEAVRASLSATIPARYRSGELSARDVAALERAGLGRVEEPARLSRLTMLPLLLKALDLALRQHALFRSRLVVPVEGGVSAATLQQHSSSLVSVALSSPKGLLTPTLPPLENETVPSIASYLSALQGRARAPRGLGPTDFVPPAAGKPGTVTLSNIGAVASGSYTFPLLPPTGQLAIGALGRTRKTPRYLSETPEWTDVLAELQPDAADELVPRLMLPVSFTADHRVVEGAELASFVQTWKVLVERPQSWVSLLQ